MQGDVTDISGRLRALLPLRWFPDQSPNLDAILTCIATPWAWLYGLIQYVVRQTRLNTASDRWLDLIAYDFCGASLSRKVGGSGGRHSGRRQCEFEASDRLPTEDLRTGKLRRYRSLWQWQYRVPVHIFWYGVWTGRRLGKSFIAIPVFFGCKASGH